jgi:8-oxo-dGTP pyrophosphatase MutT (NUDIX family)
MRRVGQVEMPKAAAEDPSLLLAALRAAMCEAGLQADDSCFLRLQVIEILPSDEGLDS